MLRSTICRWSGEKCPYHDGTPFWCRLDAFAAILEQLHFGARFGRTAPTVCVTKMVMLQFSHGIYSLKVVFLGSAVSLGWWVHFYTRFCFNPSACAFVGFGAEILVPGFYDLRIMERVAAADLSELLVQFIGIFFQFVIADTALHRKFS